MKRIIVGSRLIASGVAQTADAMASIIVSMPVATLVPSGKNLDETNVRRRIVKLKAAFGPRKVKLGDLTQDFDVLCRDALILGEDMKKAKKKLTNVK